MIKQWTMAGALTLAALGVGGGVGYAQGEATSPSSPSGMTGSDLSSKIQRAQTKLEQAEEKAKSAQEAVTKAQQDVKNAQEDLNRLKKEAGALGSPGEGGSQIPTKPMEEPTKPMP